MTDEAAMLAFAVKWRHWNGGPDEDIFVEFGISAEDYFHRLRRLLTKHRWNRLDPQILEHLVRICDDRLRIIDIRSGGDRARPQRLSSPHPVSKLTA